MVDDEPVVRQLLTEILTEEGHEVEATADGKDALNRIKEQRIQSYTGGYEVARDER